MQYMGSSFGSEDVIWPEAKLRAISHARTQNSVPYTAYRLTTMLYNIYFLLVTSFDFQLVSAAIC